MMEQSTKALGQVFAEAIRATGPNEWVAAAKALQIDLAECQRALSADGWTASDLGTFGNAWVRNVGKE